LWRAKTTGPHLNRPHLTPSTPRLLPKANKKGLKIGEILYEAPPRREKPRIVGTIKANLRILPVTLKALQS